MKGETGNVGSCSYDDVQLWRSDASSPKAGQDSLAWTDRKDLAMNN